MKTEQEAIRIREAFVRTGSILGAARECCVCWRTARAILTRDYGAPKKRHVEPSPWENRITEILDDNRADEERSRKLRITARRIHTIIQGEGCALSIRQVQRITSAARKKMASSHRDEAKLRIEARPGDYQVDFGEMDVSIRGKRQKAHVLIVASHYSNAAAYTVCESEQTDAFFDGLHRCFERLGGVPPRMRFDNCAPVARWAGRTRMMTEPFSRFAAHYGFVPEICNPRSGWEKGTVEGKVRYLRNNFFVPVPDFPSVDALDTALEDFGKRDMDRKHYLTGAKILDMYRIERGYFLDIPKPFEFCRQLHARTDRQGFIQIDGNRYYTQKSGARMSVFARVTTREIEIFDVHLKKIATHRRRYGRGEVAQPVWQLAEMLAERPSAIPALVPGACVDDLKKLRIPERVDPILQFLHAQKDVAKSNPLQVYDMLARSGYGERIGDYKSMHTPQTGNGDSGHGAWHVRA